MELWRGETENAYRALSPALREELERPLDELAQHLDADVLPAPEEMLIVARLDSPFDIRRTELEEPLQGPPQEGERRVVKLHYYDGRTGEAALIWSDERWYVDLPPPERDQNGHEE